MIATVPDENAPEPMLPESPASDGDLVPASTTPGGASESGKPQREAQSTKEQARDEQKADRDAAKEQAAAARDQAKADRDAQKAERGR